MFANNTRVLLVLSQDILDRARVMAGKATASLKLPVSLQIVLRALIREGLKRSDDPVLLANIDNQARAVRHIRAAARHQKPGAAKAPAPRPARVPGDDERLTRRAAKLPAER